MVAAVSALGFAAVDVVFFAVVVVLAARVLRVGVLRAVLVVLRDVPVAICFAPFTLLLAAGYPETRQNESQTPS